MSSSLRGQGRMGTWLAAVAVLAALTVALLATASATYAAEDGGTASSETTASLTTGPTWTDADIGPSAFAWLATLELARPTLAWSDTSLRLQPSPKPIQWIIWGCIKLGVCQILLDAPLEGVVITRAQAYGF